MEISKEQSVDISKKLLVSLRRLPKDAQPESVTFMRRGPIQLPVYSITWPRRIYTEVDAKMGDLVGFQDLSREKPLEEAKTKKEEAIEKAKSFVRNCGLLPKGEEARFAPTYPLLRKSAADRMYWLTRWNHIAKLPVGLRRRGSEESILFKDEFLTVQIDAEDAAVVGFNRSGWTPRREWAAVFPEQKLLKKDLAVQKALEQGRKLDIKIENETVEPRLEFVHPNQYWSKEPKVQTWSVRPAWIVRFGKSEDRWIELWVDAETGDIIGGDQIR